MERRRNKSLALLAALLWLLCIPTAAAAETGSLEVIDVAKPVQLYPIQDNYGRLYPDFADAGDIITEIGTDPVAAAKKLEAFTRERGCTPREGTPDEDGMVFFGNLSLGLYLICSAEEEFSPFLLYIPTMLDGETIFYMAAKPKIDSTPEPIPVPMPAEPENADSAIPQTGISVIPKYTLMGLGTVITLLGLWEMLRGREETQ